MYHHVANADTLGQVTGEVHAAEQGLWLADVFEGQHLGFTALYNPITNVSGGFLSLSIGGRAVSSSERFIALEVGVDPLRSALQVRYRVTSDVKVVPAWPSLRLGYVVERFSGWVDPPMELGSTPEGRRFFLARIGGELSYPLFSDHVQVFSGAGAGMQIDTVYLLDAESSRRLDTMTGISIAVEGGVRIHPFLHTRFGIFGISGSYLIENDARTECARGMFCLRIMCANAYPGAGE